MKNILKISTAFLLVLLTGCSKEFLDPVPQTSLSDLSVFDTKDRIVAQVNGMYAFMKSGAFLGGRFFVYGDVKADNFIPKSSNLVTNFATWNHTEVSSTNEVQNCWGAIYAAVNAINVFLDGITTRWDAGTLPTTVSQAEYDQFRSEALTLRALCYFDLLQLYAKPYNQGTGSNPGVPLRLLAEKSSEGNDLARSSVAEVYAQILKDLNDAEPLAIAKYSTDLLNTTRIHKHTIIALKTRVYLHMGDWAKVVSESAKIVSATAPFVAPSTGVAFELNPSYTAIFTTPYTSKESIFSMPFTTTNGPGTQNGLPHYYSTSSSESYYLNLNPGFAYALMDATDVRKTSLVLTGTNYFLSKFPDLTTLLNYAPVIRYAEVLLSRAEALVRAGGAVTQEAVDLLNAVRTRSFATGGYTTASFAAAVDFYNAVLLERDIEFLGEGLRTMDLQRLSLPFPAKDGGSMGSVPSIPSSSVGYIWPIPANELSLNKLMTPNQ